MRPHLLRKNNLKTRLDLDINDTIARLKKHGAVLIGEVVNYENIYVLCYLRGPEGIIIALAEQLGKKSVTDVLEHS